MATDAVTQDADGPATARRKYEQPTIVQIGSLATDTLGASGAVPDLSLSQVDLG